MTKEVNALQGLTNREMQLIKFIRELGWGEVRLQVQNGQPVLIYEAIRTVKLEEEAAFSQKQEKASLRVKQSKG
ncbi:MAG: DUF2292 domain-containing protein [Peptococcaceae bacterium]|nr:DUF2292 domain-containing protein [Peptococcaceae bacterium]